MTICNNVAIVTILLNGSLPTLMNTYFELCSVCACCTHVCGLSSILTYIHTVF